MAIKTLNTRIQNKIDLFANWTENNPVPLNGEICIVVCPSAAGAVNQEPATLIKIGDGVTAFNQLQFLSGKAANVYDWALSATKPSYSYAELSDRPTIPEDTNTTYKLVADGSNTHKFTLQAKENGSSTWSVISTITIPDNDTTYTLSSFGVTATAAELNKLGGITVDTDELNFTDGVTSNIQEQLNGKASTDHNHSGTYATASHTHVGSSVSLTGYTKAGSASAVAATDTVNLAIGKLEKALDGKQASGSYATSEQGDLASSALQPGDVSIASGTNNGTIKFTVNGETIDNISVKGLGSAAYTNSSDYATSANAMPKSGGTFTGAVTLSGAPTANNHAATKGYVDDAVSGLSGAMHFRGSVDSIPVSPYTGYVSGDVVLYGNKEYVFNGTAFVELGDESSFALKTTTVNGMALSGNVTLTAADVGAATASDITSAIQALDVSDSAVSGKYVSAVSESNGKVSITRASLPTALKNPTSLTFGSKTYDGSSAKSITAVDLGALTEHQDISGKQDTLTFDGTYNASSNKAATVSTVTGAIAALDSSVAATGADSNKYFVLTGVTEANGKLTAKTEVKLEAVAKTGNVNDVIQTSGDVLIFNCGSSSAVI